MISNLGYVSLERSDFGTWGDAVDTVDVQVAKYEQRVFINLRAMGNFEPRTRFHTASNMIIIGCGGGTGEVVAHG